MIADAGHHGFVVTVEDGIRNGGAGNFIADAIADLNANRQSPPVLSLGVPTAYLPHGKADRILGQLGLDGPGIAASIFKAIERVPDMQSPTGLRVEDIRVTDIPVEPLGQEAERSAVQADAASRG
jgi:hypothetical protein